MHYTQLTFSISHTNLYEKVHTILCDAVTVLVDSYKQYFDGACVHTPIHAYMHTLTHVHTHTCTHAHLHTRMY